MDAQFVPGFNFFQIAYVTPDIEQGMRAVESVYGVDRFFVSRDVPIDTRMGKAQLHFALVFKGEQQIEIIQPAGGADNAYRDELAAGGGALRLHHLGHLITRREEWDDLERRARNSGLALPVDGVFAHEGVALMHYLYVDTRAVNGHHLEFMYQTEAGQALFADVPRF